MCEQENEVKQCLGLKFNTQKKTIDLGVKSFDNVIEISLMIEETKEFIIMLMKVIDEAEKIIEEKQETENTDPENSEE